MKTETLIVQGKLTYEHYDYNALHAVMPKAAKHRYDGMTAKEARDDDAKRQFKKRGWALLQDLDFYQRATGGELYPIETIEYFKMRIENNRPDFKFYLVSPSRNLEDRFIFKCRDEKTDLDSIVRTVLDRLKA